MATQSHGFEMNGSEAFMSRAPETSQFEKEGEPWEVVRVLSRAEIPDVLAAGAAFAICKSTSEEPDNEAMGLVNKKVTEVYVAAAPERIEKAMAAGVFDSSWKKDMTTYAPYVCLSSSRIGSLVSVYALIESAVPVPTKLVVDDGMYVWEKQQDKLEKRKAA